MFYRIESYCSIDGAYRKGGANQGTSYFGSGFDSAIDPFRALSGGTTIGAGAGSGAGASGGISNGYSGGIMGGGSGCFGDLNDVWSEGAGGPGAGGGGCAFTSACYSGAGGSGLVAIERIG